MGSTSTPPEVDFTSPRGSTSLSPKRQQLLNWFRSNARSLAEAYEGAIRLIDDRHFPGRVQFIAHAVRDIADRLAFVLDPQQRSSRVQYENELDQILKSWPELQPIGQPGDGPGVYETVKIDYKVAKRVDSLVQDHRERRRRPSSYELLFRFLMNREPSRADVNQRLVMDFKNIHGFFMGLTHLRTNEPPKVDEDMLQAQFGAFEGMLHSFVGDFFTGTAELDEILQQANE